MLSFGCTDDVLTSHLLEYVFDKLSNEPTQRALRRSVRALWRHQFISKLDLQLPQ